MWMISWMMKRMVYLPFSDKNAFLRDGVFTNSYNNQVQIIFPIKFFIFFKKDFNYTFLHFYEKKKIKIKIINE